ncbi:MAG: hypothetical protein Q9204_005988 [Flavoplaca sp. TL-2023a]
MQHGLYALTNSERDAGGPHKDVNLPVTHFSDYGIQINVEDKTLGPGSEADGGKMKWGELRAIYQGVWSHAKEVGNTEFKIEAWRLKTNIPENLDFPPSDAPAPAHQPPNKDKDSSINTDQ